MADMSSDTYEREVQMNIASAEPCMVSPVLKSSVGIFFLTAASRMDLILVYMCARPPSE
jgi:hypothetical protein